MSRRERPPLPDDDQDDEPGTEPVPPQSELARLQAEFARRLAGPPPKSTPRSRAEGRLRARFRPVARAPWYYYAIRDALAERIDRDVFEKALRQPLARGRAEALVARMDLPRLCRERTCRRANACCYDCLCIFELRDVLGPGDALPDVAALPAATLAALRETVKARAAGPGPFTATEWTAEGLPLTTPHDQICPTLLEHRRREEARAAAQETEREAEEPQPIAKTPPPPPRRPTIRAL